MLSFTTGDLQGELQPQRVHRLNFSAGTAGHMA